MSIQRKSRPNGLHRDARGAVLVEFMVAFMPLMATFFGSLQLMQLATAKLAVKHAAILGARAGAVFSNEGNVTPDQPPGANKDKIEAAVHAALGPWDKTMRVEVNVEDRASCSDPFGPVKVTVRADYTCSVPFGNAICLAGAWSGRTGARGARASKKFEQSYTMPHQGAKYKGPKSGGACAGGGGGAFGGAGASGGF